MTAATDLSTAIAVLINDNTAAEISAADVRDAIDLVIAALVGYINGTAVPGAFTSVTETVYTLSGTALLASNGTIQEKTLAAPATLTDSLTSGQSILLHLLNGATHAVTWPTITWVSSGGDVAPTLTADDTLVLWKISSTLYGFHSGNSV